jgi:hypothetical protein
VATCQRQTARQTNLDSFAYFGVLAERRREKLVVPRFLEIQYIISASVCQHWIGEPGVVEEGNFQAIADLPVNTLIHQMTREFCTSPLQEDALQYTSQDRLASHRARPSAKP